MPDTGAPYFLPYPDLADEADAPKYIGQLAVASAAGYGISQDQPYCMANATSVQNMTTGVETAMIYHNAVDPYGMWDGVSTITAPVDGVYEAIGTFSFAGTSGAGSRIVLIRYNISGTAVSKGHGQWYGTMPGSGTIVDSQAMKAGDSVVMRQYQSTGSTLASHTQPYAKLSLMRVGNIKT